VSPVSIPCDFGCNRLDTVGDKLRLEPPPPPPPMAAAKAPTPNEVEDWR